MRDDPLFEHAPKVWVSFDGASVLNGAAGFASDEVDAHTNCALVEVGLAVGSFCEEAHHRHHWITLKDHDTDLGHALIREAFERVAKLDRIFDHSLVSATTETVEPAKGITDVALKIVQCELFAAGLKEVVTFAAKNNKDALAGATLAGFDYESVAVCEHTAELFDLMLVLDDSVEFGHFEAKFIGESLGLQFVVDSWIQRARIVAVNVFTIALIYANDA